MRRPVVVVAAEVAPVPHTSAAIAADVPHNTLAAAGSIAAVSPPSLSSPTNVEQFHEYRN